MENIIVNRDTVPRAYVDFDAIAGYQSGGAYDFVVYVSADGVESDIAEVGVEAVRPASDKGKEKKSSGPVPASSASNESPELAKPESSDIGEDLRSVPNSDLHDSVGRDKVRQDSGNGQKTDPLTFQRVGMIIPILALISEEHDYATKNFFRSYAHHLFKLIENKEFTENTYFFVASLSRYEYFKLKFHKDQYEHMFCGYGLYPKGQELSQGYDFRDVVLYKSKHRPRLSKVSKILIGDLFNLSGLKGFFKKLVYEHCRLEKNPYARFLYFYQVIEMAMELIFHAKFDEMRRECVRIGTIRERLKNLTSESDLIKSLYSTMARSGIEDKNLVIDAANKVLEARDGGYDANDIATLVYGFRNILVHNYHRKFDDDCLEIISNFMEKEAFSVLSWLSKTKPYSEMLGCDRVEIG